jgi:beta-N-acetylglucosaminidase
MKKKENRFKVILFVMLLAVSILCIFVSAKMYIPTKPQQSGQTITAVKKEAIIKATVATTNTSQALIPAEMPKEENVKEKKEEIKYTTYVINANLLNVRATAATNSKKIGELYKGQIIEAAEYKVNPEWLQTKNGHFVYKKFTMTTEKHNEKIRKNNTSRGATDRAHNMSITGYSNLSLNEVRKLLEGTRLKGIEQAVLDIEESWGVNAFFTIAVAKHESGNGYSRLAKNKNNLFGINAVDGNAYRSATHFVSKSQCVYRFGEIIKEVYIDKGHHTLVSIQNKYCSSREWASSVRGIMSSDARRVE